MDRLLVIIDPSATVQDVNDALVRQNARIVGAIDNAVRVTVSIDRQTTLADLATKAAAVENEPAFFRARPAIQASVAELPPFADKSNFPTFNQELGAYLDTGFPAVWNLRDRMINLGDQTNTSIVFTDYYPEFSHPELPTLTGVNNPGALFHHGLGVTGVTLATYDNTGLTGVVPVEPGNPVIAINVAGLSVNDIIANFAKNLPPSGEVIHNASWGYKTSTPVAPSELLNRALDALDLKALTAGRVQTLLNIVASGNENLPEDALSPFAIAFDFDDPCAITTDAPASIPLDPAEMAICNAQKLNYTAQLGPFLNANLPNIITVGSAVDSDTKSSFSNTGYAVATVGEGLPVACTDLLTDDFCNPSGRNGSVDITNLTQGTSFAAPQVTGLAYMLKRLRPDVSQSLIAAIINVAANDSDSGLIDAYEAVLTLDRLGAGGTPQSGLGPLTVANSIRGALLDVRSNTNDPDTPDTDDLFTEVDLEAFIDAYIGDPVEEIDNTPGDVNFSRFDLNGDEQTGGNNGAPFDLNNDGDFTSATLVLGGELFTFDENDVTDGNILCYLTFGSDLYTGSPEYRDIVFAIAGKELCVPNDFSLNVDVTLELRDLTTPSGWLFPRPADPIVIRDIVANQPNILSYNGNFRAPASTNCGSGERGAPRHSIGASVVGGNFYVPLVDNAPYVNNFGPVRVGGCSTFIAFENGTAWMNITQRLDRRSSGFTFENESQLRFTATKGDGTGARTGAIEYYFLGTEFAAGSAQGDLDFDFLLELKFTSSAFSAPGNQPALPSFRMRDNREE
ncbi:MAG: S8 family serine peptidase [Pseudomonadota bacterium]